MSQALAHALKSGGYGSDEAMGDNIQILAPAPVQSEPTVEPAMPAKPKRQRKSAASRSLIRWDFEKDQLLLLGLVYVCQKKGQDLPWNEAVQFVKEGATEQAVIQHLAKVRQSRVQEGQPVPPEWTKRRSSKKATRSKRKTIDEDSDDEEVQQPFKGSTNRTTFKPIASTISKKAGSAKKQKLDEDQDEDQVKQPSNEIPQPIKKPAKPVTSGTAASASTSAKPVRARRPTFKVKKEDSEASDVDSTVAADQDDDLDVAADPDGDYEPPSKSGTHKMAGKAGRAGRAGGKSLPAARRGAAARFKAANAFDDDEGTGDYPGDYDRARVTPDAEEDLKDVFIKSNLIDSNLIDKEDADEHDACPNQHINTASHASYGVGGEQFSLNYSHHGHARMGETPQSGNQAMNASNSSFGNRQYANPIANQAFGHWQYAGPIDGQFQGINPAMDAPGQYSSPINDQTSGQYASSINDESSCQYSSPIDNQAHNTNYTHMPNNNWYPQNTQSFNLDNQHFQQSGTMSTLDSSHLTQAPSAAAQSSGLNNNAMLGMTECTEMNDFDFKGAFGDGMMNSSLFDEALDYEGQFRDNAGQ